MKVLLDLAFLDLGAKFWFAFVCNVPQILKGKSEHSGIRLGRAVFVQCVRVIEVAKKL